LFASRRSHSFQSLSSSPPKTPQPRKSVRFVRDWETRVDVYKQKSGTDACVDKFHNLHIITTDGLWATLDPSGKVIRKTEDDVLEGAFACLSSENQVIVAVPRSYRLNVFSADHEPLSAVTLQEGIRSVISANDMSIRLFAPHEGYLFKDVDRKTGATIGILGSLGQSAIPSGHTRGEASMDEKRGLLRFVAHNPETVSVFDRTGKLMLSKPIAGGVRPRDDSQSIQILGLLMTDDETSGIFPLGNDKYLVNIVRSDIAPDRKIHD
jgi:hypothetical protein